MHKALLYCLLLTFLFFKSYAQVTPSDKQIMDSLIKNDDFMKMLDKMDDAKSYVRINIGIGNRLFSGNNKAVQNLDTNNQLVFTPSIGYFHKSGLSLSIASYLLSENSKLNFYQYALSPSYSYSKGKIADALISYVHYFKESKYNSPASPFDNEIYANLLFKKPHIKPGISASYSSGSYSEIIHVDTTVIVATRPIKIKYVDTASTKVSSFSLPISIQHDFEFYSLFSKKDLLQLTPQLSLISGINNYSVSHKSNTQLYNLYTKRQLKKLRRFQSSTGKSKFEIQSLGLDLDLNYAIGKINIEPEIYLDYYLPKTNDKAFTQIYNFNIGITF